MLGFRRFASRYSILKTLISDNAFTFIVASNPIHKLTNSDELHKQLNWKFIAKRATWFGGFYERLTKQCLRKVL